jgi:hypothetical protein
MGQVVDTESAKEFMREALGNVAVEELIRICREVELKSQWFRHTLRRESIPALSSSEYLSLLRRIFATHRKAAAILQQFGLEPLLRWTGDLLYGEGDVRIRFQEFVDALDGLDERVRSDFASELLHFSDPHRYWLWTRWMWDPKARTGALPLVTYEDYDISGATAGDIYMQVGRGVAFVHQVGESAGFQTISRTIFDTDVFLGCVYVVYVYTVLRMRMTQEFNKVMPGLPEFLRRLLGVYEKDGNLGAAVAGLGAVV